MTTISPFFSQAYGSDAYGQNTYTCSSDTACTTQETQVPGTPLTGFARDHSVLFYGALLVIAITLYVASLFVFKKVGRIKKKH